MPRRAISQRTLATTALSAFLFFLGAVLALHAIQTTDYSATHQAISELALGKSGWLMNVAFGSMGVGTILLALTLRIQLRSGRTGTVLLLAAGVLDFVSAAFNTVRNNEPTTTAANIHVAAGIATFVVTIIAMFVFARAFAGSEQWVSFARPTRRWAIIAIPAFFLVPILGDLFGVAQRIFIAVWFSWMIATALRARSIAEVDGVARQREPISGAHPATSP